MTVTYFFFRWNRLAETHHKRGSKSRLKFQFWTLLPLFMSAHKTGKGILPNKRLSYVKKLQEDPQVGTYGL
jgi:hypothetical protein